MTAQRTGGSAGAEAASWVIRLGGAPLTETERRALDLWLAASPDHGAAYARAQALWGEAAALKPRRPAAPRRPPVLALALLFLLGGCGLARFWYGDALTLLAADDRTAPGERRTVTLADGSRVQLDTSSAIAVNFTARQRRVRLLAGEAYFIVTPVAGAETRPFVVAAASGSARALGTQFMVTKEAEGAVVTVAEHQVRVAAAAADQAPAAITLSPGQAVRYDRLHGLEPVESVDLDQTTSWRDGRLVFDDQPLSEVVAVLNRYRHGRIVIAGDRLRRLKVSGVFMTDDLSGALAAVTQELGARTVAVPPFVTLLY